MRTRHVILGFAALLVLGEVGARIGGAISERDFSYAEEETLSSLYVPHPFVGYALRPGARSDPKRKRSYTVNSLGFRGEEISRKKPAGTYRIVCVGGSTTWGWDAWSNETTWPEMLQSKLRAAKGFGGQAARVEVINAGVPGYTLMESFVNLKMRVLPLEPDLIIVYHAANDGRAIARGDVLPDYTHVRRTWSEPPPPGFMTRTFGWSYLFGLLTPGNRAAQRDLDNRLHVPEFESLPVREADEIDEGLNIVRSTLREMVALARTHGAEIALCTYAWSRDPHPKPNMQNWMDHQVAVMERVNEVIRSVAASEKTRLIDVNEHGPRSREEFTDIIHLTDAGRQRLAETIANYIE